MGSMPWVSFGEGETKHKELRHKGHNLYGAIEGTTNALLKETSRSADAELLKTHMGYNFEDRYIFRPKKYLAQIKKSGNGVLAIELNLDVPLRKEFQNHESAVLKLMEVI